MSKNNGENKSILVIVYHVALIAGVILSAIFSYNSCQESKSLRDDAERVNIRVEAKFDSGKIKAIPPENYNGYHVIEGPARLRVVNLNPYRPIIVDHIFASFKDGVIASEHNIQVTEYEDSELYPFVVPSIGLIEKKVLISWPIDEKLNKFIIDFIAKNNNSGWHELKLMLADNPNATTSERFSDFVIYLKTHPESEQTTMLTLY